MHLHPRLVTPESLAGGVVLVVDTLRASTTIAAALFAGATTVRPVLTVDDAWVWRDRAVRSGEPAPLLGGERGGRAIEGFDLDNSPASYTADRCRGGTIVFTTTNGTAALLLASRADRVLVASLCNRSQVAGAVRDDPRPVHVLCAGTRHEIGLDDCLAAGALVESLVGAGRGLVEDDSGRLCLRAWREASADRPGLRRAMLDTRGGRNLERIGLTTDVDLCSGIDTIPVIPEFDAATGLIRAVDR